MCRYAGRAFDSEKDVGGAGTLMVKGLKSMWRQAPPIVRNTLQGVLTRIIMQVAPRQKAYTACIRPEVNWAHYSRLCIACCITAFMS